jgi:hypothetical protein
MALAACVRRLPIVLLKSDVVTLCEQRVHVNRVEPDNVLIV